MHPYLFDWAVNGHHFRPPTYGVLLALAFSLAYFEALRRAIRLSLDPKHIENLFLIVVLASVLGSRLFHVAFEDPAYYLAHPERIFAIWEGGYTFYGAVLAAMLGISVYARVRQLPFLAYGDVAASATMLGLGIGRVGCFFAGCCWGKPTTLPWGFSFSHPDAFAGLKHTPLHPAQLYEALGGFVIFVYLHFLFRRQRYPGQIFYHTLIGYGLLRFVVEIFRGDDYRGFVFGEYLSYSQFVSLLIIPFAIAGVLNAAKTKPAADPTHKPK